ncbi:sortase B [Lachnospiraceae bacterium KH1T2]|nr:sortase B [Lachnospiraceae bacterium KH1T2]
MKKKISLVITLIAAVVFVTAGFKLYILLKAYKDAAAEYSKLNSDYVDSVGTDGSDTVSATEISLDVDFGALSKINPDIKGWIYYPVLNISYPIVQTEDNEYYLTHTFYRNTNKSGAIYLDHANAPDFSDFNSLIYGHNMRDGSMFGSLKKLYQEEDLRKNNPYFYVIMADDTVYECEIFSYYVGHETSDAFTIPTTDEQKEAYINDALRKSVENTGVEVSKDDRIITLATCSGPAGTQYRFFVHGKINEIE